MTSSVSALIVVSNRLPFTLVKDKEGRVVRKAAAGGLGTAVAPVVVKSKGKASQFMFPASEAQVIHTYFLTV
jgi:hypothetical protein